MKRTSFTVGVITPLVFTVAACGHQPPSTASAETAQVASVTSPQKGLGTITVRGTEQETINARGDLVKYVGWPAFAAADNHGEATFTVTSIQIDPACTVVGQRPALGHFVELAVEVETGPEMPQQLGRVLLDPHGIRIITSDGTTYADVVDASTAACMPEANPVPQRPFKAANRYSIKLLFDSRTTQGDIQYILPPGLATNTPDRWEWSFPEKPR